MSAGARRPELTALRLADPPEGWEALGFTVTGGELTLGGVTLELGAAGDGIVAWRLRGVDPVSTIDGLATETEPGDSPRAPVDHPNGAVGIDHVVVLTPRFDRTGAALSDVGLELRRTLRTSRGFRQGFRRLGPVILELVERLEEPDGPARFWGLVVTVVDLETLADRLGEHLGPVRPAVQPGRRIATLRDSAGLGEAVAFMSVEAL